MKNKHTKSISETIITEEKNNIKNYDKGRKKKYNKG